jgi:cytochrome oxidase Cu insertion factor (SCO1/SenC/PrrC family)
MKDGTRMRLPLLGGLLVLLVMVGGGLALWPSLHSRLARTFGWWTPVSQSQSALETLGVYGEVPDFALTERSGRRITRGDLLGTVWVANFIYTQCTETCPGQSLEISYLQAEFATEPDLRLVSMTVDPERDTPEVLTQYAERYGADAERWLWLTGAKHEIYRLAADGFKLSVIDPDDPQRAGDLRHFFAPRPAFAAHGSRGLIIHSSRLVLVDRQAHIRAYHQPTDPDSLQRLRQNLRRLLQE